MAGRTDLPGYGGCLVDYGWLHPVTDAAHQMIRYGRRFLLEARHSRSCSGRPHLHRVMKAEHLRRNDGRRWRPERVRRIQTEAAPAYSLDTATTEHPNGALARCAQAGLLYAAPKWSLLRDVP